MVNAANTILYESELRKINDPKDRHLFHKIYDNKTIRLEFYTKALENKILSYKSQLIYLNALLKSDNSDKSEGLLDGMGGDGDSLQNEHYDDIYVDGGSGSGSGETSGGGTTEEAKLLDDNINEMKSSNFLVNTLRYYMLLFLFFLKPPFKGTQEEKILFGKR